MRKADVVIGGIYECKVSGRVQAVQIVGSCSWGGWNAVNVETGRDVRVKTAARLRRLVSARQTEIAVRLRERARLEARPT